MLPKVLLTGVPGVGKTTIGSNSLLIDAGFQYFQIGENMIEIGKRNGFLETGADLNNLQPGKRRELQNLVVEEMNRQHLGKGLLVDGHIIVDSNLGFIPGIEFDMIEKCGFSAIIVVRGEVDNIVYQRKQNHEKYFAKKITPEHITIHQDLVYSSALLFSMQCYISIHFINNKYGEVNNSVKQVLEIMKSQSNK